MSDRSSKPPQRDRLVYASLAMVLLIMAMASVSCSILKPTAMPPLTRRIAVLDFKVPKEMADKPRQVKGWWLGADTVNQNPWSGGIFADTLARDLLRLKYLEQQSRNDLKYYMGEKRQRLVEEFEGLKPADYDRMLLDVSPIDYGAELGVDHIITGEILEAYTSQHRTIKSWYSKVRVRVDVHDMASGRVVWSKTFAERDLFMHPLDVMEKIAPRVTKALDKFYKKQNKAL